MEFLVLIALVAVSLAACAGGPGLGSANCADGSCITLGAVEPVQYGLPVTVTITVTSEKDQSNLNVILYTNQVGYKDNLGVTVADPAAPEATAGPAISWNFCRQGQCTSPLYAGAALPGSRRECQRSCLPQRSTANHVCHSLDAGRDDAASECSLLCRHANPRHWPSAHRHLFAATQCAGDDCTYHDAYSVADANHAADASPLPHSYSPAIASGADAPVSAAVSWRNWSYLA